VSDAQISGLATPFADKKEIVRIVYSLKKCGLVGGRLKVAVLAGVNHLTFRHFAFVFDPVMALVFAINTSSTVAHSVFSFVFAASPLQGTRRGGGNSRNE
jgi:hypothetical protein